MLRDARFNMIQEGSNEVMRAFIGLAGIRSVGIDLKEDEALLKNIPGNFKKLGGTGNAYFPRLQVSSIPIIPALERERRQLDKSMRIFGLAVRHLLAQEGGAMSEDQLSLDRIATAAIALYTSLL